MGIANRRSAMTLYSGASCAYSHRARIVLAAKAITYDVVDIDSSPKALEELASLNPYGTIPTLLDRDLVIYNSDIIMEYLDERFPHPPLLPVFPVSKAKTRVAIHRINEDWYTQMRIILNSNASVGEVEAARKSLTDSLTSITPVFVEMPFFLSEEFTLIDCCMAPLLWRLELMQIKLPAPAKAVLDYAHRLFELECFQKSLTEKERTMRW